VKLIGKLQDDTVFFNKGYSDVDDEEADLFEFKTDEGKFSFPNVSSSHLNLFLYQLYWVCILLQQEVLVGICYTRCPEHM